MGQRRAHQTEVLQVLKDRGRAMTAYEVLDELRKSRERLAPNAVYRALAALQAEGLVHRVESVNAFVLCQSNHGGHPAILSICGDCRAVEEHSAPAVVNRLATIARTTGFTPKQHVIEVQGTCLECAAMRGAPA